MIKPNFEIGYQVLVGKAGITGTITDRRYSPAISNAPALKTYLSEGVGEATFSMAETYLYRVTGEGIPSWWIPEYSIISAEPCPGCQSLGWDLIIGCDICGLTLDDLVNYHTVDLY